MAKGKEEKESVFNRIMKITDSFGNIIEKISVLLKNQLDSLKKKLIEMGIVFGLLFISIFIIVIGFSDFLSHKLGLEPGISSLLIGGSLLILTMFYLLVKKK